MLFVRGSESLTDFFILGLDFSLIFYLRPESCQLQYIIPLQDAKALMYAARRRQKSVHWKFQSCKLGIRQPFQLFNDLL